jgi:hypothetical protein
MERNADNPWVSLAAGEVLSLDNVEGILIHARDGTVWITEENDLEDHIVGPGCALVIDKPGRTVVQAIAPARISIRAPANDPTQTAA